MKGQIITGADGSALYITVDGDMIDAIAHAYYGKHERNTEAILEANPDIADMDQPILPAGIVVTLPQARTDSQPKAFRKLWD